MLFVFLSTQAGNEYIINIGVRKRKTTNNLVDKTLKGLRGVVKTTWHLYKFIKSKGCCYGHFMDISWFHRDLVVISYQVQSRKNCRSNKSGRKVLDMRDGIAIGLGDII